MSRPKLTTWLSALLLAAALTAGLQVRGDQGPHAGSLVVDAPDGGEAEAPAVTYDHQSVVYGAWRLDFAAPSVVWSAEDGDDVVVMPVRVSRVGSVQPALFADVESFAAYPADKAGMRDALDRAQGTDAEGRPLYDTSAESKELDLGESIELTFAWRLDGNYDAIRLDVQGYSVSAYETSVLFSDLTETPEHRARAAEIEERKGAPEADIGGAVVTRPAGWYFDGVGSTSVLLGREDGTGGFVEITYRDYSMSTPVAEANKYMGRYGEPAPRVVTTTVGDNDWAYFVPSDGQFLAWTQARPGLIEARGTLFDWESALDVIAGIDVR